MIFDPNDPRLTAFVLGELDPTEREAVQSLMDESPECRYAVDEIRLTVEWLTRQLHEEKESHEPAIKLNHQVIAETLAAPAITARPWWRNNGYKLFGLAALLLLGATVSVLSIVPAWHNKGHHAERIAILAQGNVEVREMADLAPAAAGKPMRIVSEAKALEPMSDIALSQERREFFYRDGASSAVKGEALALAPAPAAPAIAGPSAAVTRSNSGAESGKLGSPTMASAAGAVPQSPRAPMVPGQGQMMPALTASRLKRRAGEANLARSMGRGILQEAQQLRAGIADRKLPVQVDNHARERSESRRQYR
jgi:hypothetical protein